MSEESSGSLTRTDWRNTILAGLANYIDAGSIVLPNALFAGYEALAARLKTAAADSAFPVYILPQASMMLRVVDSVTEQIQTSARLIVARRGHP